MALVKRTQGRRRLITAGDLSVQVVVKLRTLVPPSGAGVDPVIELTNAKKVWAMLLTESGQEFFDGVNLKRAYTHVFYIRFIANTVFVRSGRMSSEERVEYKGRTFQVIDVENYEERDEFLVLRCVERGASDIAANLA